MSHHGKTTIITGAGSGIGKAAALLFAREGAAVGVLSEKADEVRAVAGEIARGGGKALPLVADVGDAEQVRKAIEEAVEKLGGIDILFANAGINGVWAPVEEITPDEWDRTVRTNLTGTFLPIHFAVPHLKRRGCGCILITSSINGTRVFSNTGATAYSATKAAQLAVGQMLALELARWNIRVNVICPGWVTTNIGQSTEQRNIDKVKIKAEYGVGVPLSGKPATPEEVAQLALFLASDNASHITGTPVWIDGGESLLRG